MCRSIAKKIQGRLATNELLYSSLLNKQIEVYSQPTPSYSYDPYLSIRQPLRVIGDITIDKNAARLIENTINLFGRLDVLVNNAGLYQPKKIDEPDAVKTFNELLQINLISVVALTAYAVPHLKKSKGCVVNVSSNLHSRCIEGGFAYSTAKAGLTMFTKSIAVDLAPDVRVNSVSPGPIATLMPTRVGMNVQTYRDIVASACLVNRVGEPDEVARVILFLASPESAFITGTDIVVDGGSTIKPAGAVMRRPQ